MSREVPLSFKFLALSSNFFVMHVELCFALVSTLLCILFQFQFLFGLPCIDDAYRMAFNCVNKKYSSSPESMPFDAMIEYLAMFSRSRRRLFQYQKWSLKVKREKGPEEYVEILPQEMKWGVDAINCGTDIRHFEDFLSDYFDYRHPLTGKVHKRFAKIAGFRLEKTPAEKKKKEDWKKKGEEKQEGQFFERDPPLEFKYEFIFHEVEDYEEIPMPTNYGDGESFKIPPVIGCSFHPVGFFKPKA